MTQSHPITLEISNFFDFMRKRYISMVKKNEGIPRPWSDDPILQREYFCNIFREDDKTTTWFRNNMRDKIQDNAIAALITIPTFRWFNKIEIGRILNKEDIELQNGFFNFELARERILSKYKKGPYVTGAYVTRTPAGMNKLDGILRCIDNFWNGYANHGKMDKILSGKLSIQDAWRIFTRVPYIGSFMAWQICLDAKYTCLLRDAPDRDTWCPTFKNSDTALKVIFPDRFDIEGYLSLTKELVDISNDGLLWNRFYPRLTVPDMSHSLCEYSKYLKALSGKKTRRRYVG